MNNIILKRAIDELSKSDFRKDYVLGMLETLYEISEPNTKGEQVANNVPNVPNVPTVATSNAHTLAIPKDPEQESLESKVVPQFLKEMQASLSAE